MSTPTQQRDREFIRLCKLHYENLKHQGQNPTPYRIVLDVLAKPGTVVLRRLLLCHF